MHGPYKSSSDTRVAAAMLSTFLERGMKRTLAGDKVVRGLLWALFLCTNFATHEGNHISNQLTPCPLDDSLPIAL